MERVLCVKVQAPVASFRQPLEHNYQRTFIMPPPTTLVGLAGAALGISDYDLWSKNSLLREIKVSVLIDTEPGRAQDMWTLLKIKKGKMLRSPYTRELLFGVNYTLLYGGNEELLRQLQYGFRDPVYPLSLGREDELLFIKDITMNTVYEGESTFHGTILPCDIRKEKFRPILRHGIRFEPPLVEKLPLSFSVDSSRVRHAENRRVLSFLPLKLVLEVPSLLALQVDGRNFTWMNY